MAIKGAIQLGELNDELRKIIGKYNTETRAIIEDAAEKSAKFAVQELKKTSPKGKRGDYRKGWRLKRDYSGRRGVIFIVHNATDYRLTHLLEKGHATKNGTGRVFGDVGAKVHIKPVEEKAVNMFLELVEEGVKNGA